MAFDRVTAQAKVHMSVESTGPVYVAQLTSLDNEPSLTLPPSRCSWKPFLKQPCYALPVTLDRLALLTIHKLNSPSLHCLVNNNVHRVNIAPHDIVDVQLLDDGCELFFPLFMQLVPVLKARTSQVGPDVGRSNQCH